MESKAIEYPKCIGRKGPVERPTFYMLDDPTDTPDVCIIFVPKRDIKLNWFQRLKLKRWFKRLNTVPKLL